MRKFYAAFLTGKSALFLLLSFLMMLGAKAQTDITIGTGTAGNTTTSYPAAMQDYWEGSRSQYLYTAAELTAAGMSPGNIVGIKFNVSNINTAGLIEKYNISIGSTATTSLSTTTWEPGTSSVFGPVDYQPVAGDNTFTFSSPFIWNGTDNVVIEICNGEPGNATGTWYTVNATTPWTTGLPFNGSHNTADDNLGNGCGATGLTDRGGATSRPNITFSWIPGAACTGTPAGGTTTSTVTSVCSPATSISLSVTGATAASGLSYLWQTSPNGTTWTDVPTATSSSYTLSGITTATFFRRKITCGVNSSFSAPITITVSAATFAALPFTESFENTWVDVCNTRDVPNNSWRNNPVSGNSSWRRNDDGVAAAWLNPTFGAYLPAASNGTFSARFHTYQSGATKGQFDLYVNCATGTAAKRLNFDYINTNGNDSLVVYVSTNGGATFTRLDSVRTATAWTTKSIVFNSTAANTVLRFEGGGDQTFTDIGLDNINLITLVACTGAPVGGTVNPGSIGSCAGTPFTLTVTGSTDITSLSGLSVQWQQSTDGGVTWTNIAGATGANYSSTGISATTRYRRQITCAGSPSVNSTETTVTIASVAYAPMPFTESFENNWLSVCDVNEVPNNFWRNSPLTGNQSWRRNDDGVSANWTAPATALYTPNASVGTYSARFHTYFAPGASKGQLNLYLNAATGIPSKKLAFDFINTDGGDSLTVFLSTNGGTTFTRLDSVRTSTIWRTKTIQFTSTSATTVIRFEATSDFGFTDIGLDNINVIDFPACSGTPVAGITVSTSSNVCPSTPFTLSVTGATDAAGITYQWQSSPDGVTWTNVATATAASYNVAGITVSVYYRRQILCSGSSSFSTPIQITLNAPTYAVLPYAESFEATWINGCGIRDIPNNSWRNVPVTGNTSWRRNDDGFTSGGWVSNLGAYTPDASVGNYSARFHSYDVTGRGTGKFDLYINAATPSAAKQVSFDFINLSGSDSLTISLSTNGGATFIRLDSARLSDVWRSKQVLFSSTSATTVIRFEATGDFGVTDIGLDNILITDFAPCVGAPNAGTAVSSSASVCSEQFTLSLVGSSSAAGLTYQWQRSTNNTTWTDIPGATSISYSTAQTGTTFYRAIVKCGSEFATSTSVQVVSPTLVSGTFAINNAVPTNIAGATFNTFNDAYNYIKCGINGPVTFNVVNNLAGAPGAYNEQLIMTAVPGASAVNTVTFKGQGSTIGFVANNINERAVIKLRGADYIRFDSLIINSFAGTYGYGVQLISNADSNIISNCIINLNTTATTTNFAGIVINGTEAGPISVGTVLSDYNVFDKNTINGGYAGVTLVASLTGSNGNNVFTNNTIKDFYQYGFYVSNSYGTLIEGNNISRPTRATVTSFTGIYFTGISTRTLISKNRITNPFGGALASTSAFTGIEFVGVDATTANENFIQNNQISNVNGQGTQVGISNNGSDNNWYLHNTISLDSAASTSTSTTRGFFQTTAAGGIVFFDNLISISRGGTGAKHAIYMATATTGIQADYNNYYVGATAGTNFVGFFNTNQLTLANWQAASAIDANSIARDPFYANAAAGNLTPTNGAVDNKGIYAGIDTDIVNAARSNSTPDMGAYEFTALPCTLPPVPGNTLFNDTTVCQNSPVRLNLSITSWGAAQTFQWQTATSATGPWTNLSGLRSDPDTTILSSTSLFYRAAVTCGGTTVFSNPLQLLVSPALPTGTYTINKTLPTNYVAGNNTGNFASFNDAKAAMSCGIIGGAVVFNVVPGTGVYNEQLRLDSIPGVSAVNTITFNGNGNTISFNVVNNAERAIIKLSGADHIRFDSLTIDASAGTFGYGVQLVNNADSNIFRKCTIISSTTSTSTNYAGVVINASETSATATGNTFTDGNLFDRNTITGGYYGVTLVGSTTALTFVNNNKFTNNTIQDFYNYGMYVGGTVNTLIEGNLFTRPARATAATSVYGLYFTAAASNRISVSKNRFTRFFSAGPVATPIFYGIYHNLVSSPAGNEAVMSNNLVYSIEGNGAQYGFYNATSNNIFYYHNTVALDNALSTTTATTVGMYQTGAATGIFFKNNMVTVRRGGTGTKYAMYRNTVTGAEVNASNNNYFVSGTNAFVGFYNAANRQTLAQWQAATAQDAGSLNLNPLYADTATGNYKPQLTGLDNKGTPLGIATDIVNAVRSNTTPDIGAYEFAPIGCQNPPVAGVATVTPSTGICLETPIRLSITGNSPLGNLTFQWQYSPDGTTGWTNISGVQYFPEFDTITTVNRFYRAAVVCDGATVYTNVVSVNLNPLLLAGVYSIDPAGAGPNNFTSFQNAVTAMLCGITGPVTFNVAAGTYNEKIRIPYIPNTSTVNTVTFQSANGIASSVNLSAAGTAPLNYTLRLDSTRYFTFRNMTFSATDAVNGRAVEFFNEASNNNFLNNTVVSPTVTAASTNVAGIYAGAFRGRNITIKGNTVTGGSRGIHFAGTSTIVLANAGHVIDSNTVSGSYNYGIFTEFTNRISITRNNVSFAGPVATSSAGIYASYADTASRITGNTVAINGNTGTLAYGLQVVNSRNLLTDSTIIANNRISSDSNNTGTIYGITLTTSKAVTAVNNVVAINNSGAIAYGLYSLNNTDDVNWFNNTSNVSATAANGYAGYFNHTAANKVYVNNNIFSNNGGGRALFVNNPTNFTADYNLLYTSGASLVQVATGATLNFPNLKAWTSTWNWDRYSISYVPAFISNTNLRPDLANPDVWAIHGRGTQLRGNSYDFDNNSRPQTLTAGVPDLGAYEFFPTAQPTVLLAIPATPAPNSTQVFSYGTDTVMKITWGATAPPTVAVRRFSGVVPTGLGAQDSMFFYTKVDVGGTNTYQYAAKLYYINPWQGSIPQQFRIGLGRTTPSNAWVVGQNSRVDVGRKEISQDAIVYLDRFTGLVNPSAVPESNDSTSNRGKDFWVGYQRTNGFSDGNVQNMVLYLGAGDQAANVTVTIEGTTGTPWVRNYSVPANTTLTSDFIPKAGADDARLILQGQYNKKGIHITSDVPIVAYAHIYESTNSGATMLLPSTVWGYEYYTLQSRQNYTSVSYSAFHIVAQHDSTLVEINPSAATQNGMVPNGGTQPNGSYLVRLNKGDAYQVLGTISSGSEGVDLSGSYVKSIGGTTGCYPIAVFAGSTRTAIGCGGTTGGSGDLIIQQIFPYQAWGTKYLTASTTNSNGPNASSNMTNIYRVLVKDPTTVVKRNGVVIPVASLIGSRYYQFEANNGEYIEANKPVMVAEYMSSNGACTNTGTNGDPEMFYLSPVEQAIKRTQFYRNNLTAISSNYITLIIPTEGLNSLRIDGVNYSAYPATLVYASTHPGTLPGYSIVTKRWAAGSGSSTVESDYPFTGIVYGEGSVESYGYNLGTLVKNLNNLSTINTTLNSGANVTGYTCKGAQFRITALLPLVPDSIRFLINAVPGLTPSANVTLVAPVPSDTVEVNGVSYYTFMLPLSYTLDSAGTFNIPIQYWSPEIESCDKRKDGTIVVQVLPKPVTNFGVTYANGGVAGCQGDNVTLTGDLITSNGIALNQWQWTYAPGGSGGTASGQVQTLSYPAAGTYAVTLRGVTADGCVSDTTKNIVINARPTATAVNNNIGVCAGDNVTFQIASPQAGVVYNWYDAATGGTLLATGTSYTATNVTPPVSFYIEPVSNGCVSTTRTQVTAAALPTLAPAVVTVQSVTANSVTFAWTAIPGATGYQVSENGGTFVSPSSGPTGLTHTVSGLGTLQQVTLRVRAITANVCQTSTSPSVAACTNSTAVVSNPTQSVCPNTPVTFNVQSPVTGITYNWYTTATGGTPIATGAVFTSPVITATTTYYLEQASATCTSTTRTAVTVNLLPNLAPAVVRVVSADVNSVTFGWTPVANAAAYQVSVGGALFVTPSSGATGLTHTVTGLRPLDTVSVVVRAIGTIACQTSTSGSVSGRTLPDQIYIPNTFSPNGDGRNDQLLVYGYTIRETTFTVYNQWGEKIFESRNQSTGWDGSFKNKPQPSGVYIYVAKFILRDGTTVDRRGSINLVR